MVAYAKISQMIEFQTRGIWPLPPRGSTRTVRNVVEDVARIVLRKGPVKSVHVKPVVPVPTEVLRWGTRGWEYPWVAERLQAVLKPGAKVLDCGCGVNGFPLQLGRLGYDAHGLDYFVGKEFKREGYGLPDAYVKRHSNEVTFLGGGMESIPAGDNTFDAATCISVMEHVVIDHKNEPSFHLRCLEEMKRVLKPGGLLICTYDTILNNDVVYANKYGWGTEGWYYKNDIEHMVSSGMNLLAAGGIPSREDIQNDEDCFFIPPDMYFALGYGSGFEQFGVYHRLTSVGFVLTKEQST